MYFTRVLVSFSAEPAEVMNVSCEKTRPPAKRLRRFFFLPRLLHNSDPFAGSEKLGSILQTVNPFALVCMPKLVIAGYEYKSVFRVCG